MGALRVVLCVVASVPAAWFAGALFERVPPRRPLFRPLPGYQLSGVYFTIQALTTVLFVVAALRFDDASVWRLVAYLVFFTAAVALSVIDIDTLRLPDAIVAGTMVVAIPLITVASLVEEVAQDIQLALIGAAAYFGFLLIAHLAFPRGMGFGDVKLAALLGLYLGWSGDDSLTALVLVLYAMLVGFLVGSGVGILLFSFRRKSVSYPFGPFLIGGAILVIAFSPALLPAPL